MMIAVGLSLCYLANNWNIGAEGQFMIGAVAGSWHRGADQRHRRRPLGAAGDARARRARRRALCADPGALQVHFGASEILTSLMLVYVADLCSTIWCAGRGAIRKGSTSRPPPSSIRSHGADRCSTGGRLHAGSVIALIVVAARGGAARPHASRASRSAWSAPRRARRASPASAPTGWCIFAFAVSGALAGLAGIIEVAGRSATSSPASRRATASPPSSSPSSAGSIRSASWSPACSSR